MKKGSIVSIIGHKLVDWLPDKAYLKLKYRLVVGKKLHLKNPKTYTEKLQWLKLYDRKNGYTQYVDKAEAKRIVEEKIGKDYIIPTYGIWERAEDIEWDKLPNQFVIKCTHDSGSILICKDKQTFDTEKAKKKLRESLKKNLFVSGREWPYKNVPPRIIAEKYMEDAEDRELRDYKFFTFGGKPKAVYITQGRGGNRQTVADFYDMEFHHLEMKIDHEMAETKPKKPVNFDLMKELAEKLSNGTPQLRVDFYEVDGKVYFGELTFFHCSGFIRFSPETIDEQWGEWVSLPLAKHKNQNK